MNGTTIEKRAVAFRARVNFRQSQNLCVRCSGENDMPVGMQPLCADCWFKNRSKWSTGTSANWIALKSLMEDQGYRCAYTGIDLVIGVNASIDHIIPVSAGGKREVKNIQWVDGLINRMKTNMSHDEFLQTVKLIASRF